MSAAGGLLLDLQAMRRGLLWFRADCSYQSLMVAKNTALGADNSPAFVLLTCAPPCESTARSQGSSRWVSPASLVSNNGSSMLNINVAAASEPCTAAASPTRSTRASTRTDLETIRFRSTHGPSSNSQ